MSRHLPDETQRTSNRRDGGRGPGRHCSALVVAIEASRPLAGGARYVLDGVSEVRVGRGPERAARREGAPGSIVLRIDIPDRRLSSDHARLTFQDGRWTFEDLGSTNGSFIDGERVAAGPVGPSAILELGHTLLLLRDYDVQGRVTDLDLAPGEGELPGLSTLDPVLAARLERLGRVAASLVPVMLLGETGTGKEVLARAVHTLSKRPGPLVAVNCGAIPPTLMESQLFGHLKGAFTGAARDEAGYVRSANFGTLFLDEIGDLPAASQAALLRVLQEGEVVPVGAAKPTKVDVRVVCATHRPLEELMDAGTFRRDLYARLAGFVQELPPLRQRREDVGVILASLLLAGKVDDPERIRLRPEVARAFLSYDWPLNVRELQQALHTSAVLADEGVIGLSDLPPALVGPAAKPTEGTAARDEESDALRRELVAQLTATGGNVSEVARNMGKARQQVQRWLRRFGLDPERYRVE